MILFDFKTYINEAKNTENYVDLFLSKRFIDVLSRMKNCPIKYRFMGMITDSNLGRCNQKFEVSFIDVIDGKEDTLSYITSNKAKQILDKYISIKKEWDGINLCWVNNRQEQKIPRLINRLFTNEFKHSDIEEFTSEYKASFLKDNITDKFEIIKGKDVKRYYYGGNYSQEGGGHLQRSCMKYSECQGFFQIFMDNPDKMNMLILKDPNGRIYGRANIWYLDHPEGKIFMDRIYTTFEWQTKLFIDYAIRNNWIYKAKQIYGGSVIPVYVDGRKDNLIMSVKLKPISYDAYPYIDTLQFYNPDTGELTSDVKKFRDDKFLTLVTARGEPYQDDGESFRIDYLGRIVHHSILRWSEHDQVWIHQNDAISLGYRDDYVTPEHEFINIGGRVYLKEDTDVDKETGEIKPKRR